MKFKNKKPQFWLNNDVSDVLREIIEPDDVDVSSIQMHDTLSPLIWDDNNQLKPDIRKTLLMNAKRFIEFADVEKLKFDDIILVGSMTNYNYNENSDLDVHIILDFNQISNNEEIVNEFLKLKKNIWNDSLPIQVKGHDVEMYFQNSNENVESSGIYSLIKNKWLKKPIKKLININTPAVKLKSADFMNAIDDLENNENNVDFINRYNKIKDKIKKYRQSGLSKEGEYSIENLVFKVLRNTDYLKKLIDIKNEYLTKELSLKEVNN